MVFCDDKKPNCVKDEVDLELKELSAVHSISPGSLAAAIGRKPSQEVTLETDDSMEEDTNVPVSSHFPAPPQFLTASSGEQIKLTHADNTKLKILVVIATFSIIVSVAFGVWNVSLHYGKKAENSNPDDSGCDGLAARLEFSLKALTDLREPLTSLTRLSQNSLTSTSDNAVDSTWNSSPKYT